MAETRLEGDEVLQDVEDREEIIERVAALDIGKAELVCCVRVPDPDRPGRRLQEVRTYSTMTGRWAGSRLVGFAVSTSKEPSPLARPLASSTPRR